MTADPEGRPFDGLPDDLPAPSLLVAPVSEAVKRVEGDRLAEDLDRSRLWLVRGIAVDRVVMESVPDGSYTMTDLIRQVEAAGHAWGIAVEMALPTRGDTRGVVPPWE